MRKFITRALWGTLLAGGLTLVGTSVAMAAETDGEDGLLSGTQALIDVAVPVTVEGNGISILGDSSSTSDTDATPTAPAEETSASTSGADGTASGTQALISVSVPVVVEDTAVSVVGDSSSETDAAATEPADTSPSEPSTSEASTSGEDGTASGTQAIVPVSVPVTLGGNAISVLGDSESATTGGSGSTGGGSTDGTADTTGTGGTTDGTDGILGGTQVIAPVDIPVEVGGNAISVLGDSESTTGASGSTGERGGTTGTDGTTGGSDGIGSGTQVIAPVGIPIGLGGNAVSVIGDSTTTTEAPTTPTGPTGPTDPTDPTDPGTTDPGTTDPGSDGSMSGDDVVGAVAGESTAVRALAETGGGSLLPLVLFGGLLMLAGGVMRLARRSA